MTKINIGIRLPPKSSRIWDSLYLVNQSRRGRKAYLAEFQEASGFEKVEGRDWDREVKVKWIKEQVGEENESEGDQETTQEESRQAGEEYVLLCQSVRRRAKEEAIYSGPKSAL